MISRYIKAILILTFVATSCDKSDEFDTTGFTTKPKIEFQTIDFKDSPPGEADSIVLTISYKDLEGDLGLDQLEIDSPYNWLNFFSNKTGSYFDFENEKLEDLLIYSDRAIIDTLPPFNDITKCLNWDTNIEFLLANGSIFKDTIYVKRNIYHYNYLIDYYFQNSQGQFELFDWELEIGCYNSFDSRFPLTTCNRGTISCIVGGGRSPFTIEVKSPYSGNIRFAMASFGFKSLFGGGNIKLKVRIIDRALNISNAIETEELFIPN